MAEVLLEELHKSFGGVVAVEPMDLRIADGELVVFVGPSGCGKSTTLRMVAGLESVTSGQIRFDGRDVTTLEPKDRNVAMVFQNYALYPQKTVFENLAFGLKMRRAPKAEVRERVAWAARMLGIESLLDRKPKQLSGGQMQRVALGRALVREPAVFLLDEPLSNLDAKLRVKMRDEIARLHRRLGRSMVYVTHDQVEAMTLGDRIVVMRDGHVQQVGHPLEVYDRPANLFVAGFIGAPEINLITGRCSRTEGRLWFAGDGWRFPLPDGLGEELPEKELVFGIRPEHVLVDDRPEAVEAEVVLVEQMGASTLVAYDVQGTEIRVLSARDDTVRTGMTRRLLIEGSRGHFFDPQTGNAISSPRRATTSMGGGANGQQQQKQQDREQAR